MPSNGTGGNIVMVGEQVGLAILPSPTPLTRLNYFDGKFLRADDLNAEQQYVRKLVHLSNQAGGAGVVHGLDTQLGSGDNLRIGPGMAIDPLGRVLLLPADVTVDLQNLIEASRKLVAAGTPGTGFGLFGDCVAEAATPPTTTAQTGDLFVITISLAEGLCGVEDVYGKLCEEACVSTTDRPYRVEGLVLRALPLALHTQLVTWSEPLDNTHLRSRVASAFFAEESLRLSSLISKYGLSLNTWCLGAKLQGGGDVPLAVLARQGTSTIFLDAWTVRRERIDAPPKRYWAWRMAMRSWDIYLAQILQFQCQLHGLLESTPVPGTGTGPCTQAESVLKDASKILSDFESSYAAWVGSLSSAAVSEGHSKFEAFPGGAAHIAAINLKVSDALKSIHAGTGDRVLIRGGIVELPSAGYLPVVPGSAVTINSQVAQLMGEGVDLRFCVVRPDFVPHALEEAQHMERISLIHGLDHPEAKPKVDILVPNGQIMNLAQPSKGMPFAVRLEAGINSGRSMLGTNLAGNAASQRTIAALQGAGHGDRSPSGGLVFNFAARTQESNKSSTTFHASGNGDAENVNAPGIDAAIWGSMNCQKDPFKLSAGEETEIEVLSIAALIGQGAGNAGASWADFKMRGKLRATPSSGPYNFMLTGDYLLATTQGGEKKLHGPTVNVPVGLNLDTSGLRPKVVLKIQIEDAEFAGEAAWLQDPAIKVEVAIQSTSEPWVFAGDIDEDSSVLNGNNALHVSAISALELLETVSKKPAFADGAALGIFPPPPAPSQDLLVHGTLDWVLFHRRRDRVCGVEAPAPPGVKTDRYRLWVAKVDERKGPLTQVEPAQVTGTKLPGEVLFSSNLEFELVDVVEFGAGLPTLVTPPSSIRIDLSHLDPGGMGVYSVIAAPGTPEQLALTRLGRLKDAIEDLVVYDDATPATYLPVVPPEVPANGNEGSIVIFTKAMPPRSYYSYSYYLGHKAQAIGGNF